MQRNNRGKIWKNVWIDSRIADERRETERLPILRWLETRTKSGKRNRSRLSSSNYSLITILECRKSSAFWFDLCRFHHHIEFYWWNIHCATDETSCAHCYVSSDNECAVRSAATSNAVQNNSWKLILECCDREILKACAIQWGTSIQTEIQRVHSVHSFGYQSIHSSISPASQPNNQLTNRQFK